MSRSVWDNIAQGNYLGNVGPWQIKVNNLYNAASTILGHHCIRILSSRFCPNMSETILHKKTTCKVVPKSRQTCFCPKTGCSFKCLVACFLTRHNITKESWFFLFNVGSWVQLWLAGQQWTGANIDWKIIKSIEKKISQVT